MIANLHKRGREQTRPTKTNQKKDRVREVFVLFAPEEAK